MANRSRTTAPKTAGVDPAIVQNGRALISKSGVWATRMLKAAALEGQILKSGMLRTLDTLRHEEWKYFDDAVLEEAKIRLRGVAALIAAGLTIPVADALSYSVFAYEKMTDLANATTSMNGLTRTPNDNVEFDLNQIPLPITHKDFFIDLRHLASSRRKGEPLDTLQSRVAARVVSEQLEYMLFNGGPTFGGLPIYGILTEPHINTDSFDGGDNWETPSSGKAGSSYLADVLNMITKAHEDRMYGPYVIFCSTAAGVNLENDFKANVSQTIRQRLLTIDGITDIIIADQFPAGKVALVQMTQDVVAWIEGEPIQNIQWDEYGGMMLNFKVWSIAVPLVRSDVQGRSGIVVLQ